uniref:Uncharacterized protein n=1 Tax=Glossina austeni TaxID=7395 RepID=A0A1A9V3W9_GLOAU
MSPTKDNQNQTTLTRRSRDDFSEMRLKREKIQNNYLFEIPLDVVKRIDWPHYHCYADNLSFQVDTSTRSTARPYKEYNKCFVTYILLLWSLDPKFFNVCYKRRVLHLSCAILSEIFITEPIRNLHVHEYERPVQLRIVVGIYGSAASSSNSFGFRSNWFK